jgi:recombination protein RecA
VAANGLAGAIARIEGRFGVHALARGGTSERHRGELVIATKSSLDRVIGGGLIAGEPIAFVGPPSVGKLHLALRATASAQAQGGMAAWIDPTASFDPLAAERASVDLERLIVIRARG